MGGSAWGGSAPEGIAFDLDGTLYPNYRFYARIIPFVFKHYRLVNAMGKARTAMRRGPPPDGYEDRCFYGEQARLMAAALGESPEAVKQKTEALIYRGWEPLFKRIKPYRHLRQTLEQLRGAGFKLGLLSDFPPENKLAHMELDGFWDALLCSEVLGRLKPDPLPFRRLAERLGLPPARILYVGNSVPYDIKGAKQAGMKAALIRPAWMPGHAGGADLVFSSYRRFSAYMAEGARQ
ncbi:MAG: HAD family hydrolase [Treponema sp.]|nr:HAD family hydrolase [Treponema sp.]